ncbi:class II histocompatibility antigen, B-L beta chain-like [Neopelma chrysocephalum]|uniref:class II histocompatibility antigen, B-L beta chain-like n=1 Tax=Neopelma chrysocephalum TaxID=114329 RepID=UPI000FCD167A|nr:class II histocompatibility antigen, B-L beta chain-like [Neopelma chrysocephalum]
MTKHECHFINGTERVSYVHRQIYNREQLLHFDSDVGVFVGDIPFGEIQARIWNSKQDFLEICRAAVDTVCWPSYERSTQFLENRRGERGAERVPSDPAPGMTLEPLKPSLGITPDPSALPVPVPWSFVLSQFFPVHRSLSQCPLAPPRLPPEMPPDTVRSKILVGVGGFVLGLVFLALGLGFYLREKSF